MPNETADIILDRILQASKKQFADLRLEVQGKEDAFDMAEWQLRVSAEDRKAFRSLILGGLYQFPFALLVKTAAKIFGKRGFIENWDRINRAEFLNMEMEYYLRTGYADQAISRKISIPEGIDANGVRGARDYASMHYPNIGRVLKHVTAALG